LRAGAWISEEPARSAIVRDSVRIRSYARAESPSRWIALRSSSLVVPFTGQKQCACPSPVPCAWSPVITAANAQLPSWCPLPSVPPSFFWRRPWASQGGRELNRAALPRRLIRFLHDLDHVARVLPAGDRLSVLQDAVDQVHEVGIAVGLADL